VHDGDASSGQVGEPVGGCNGESVFTERDDGIVPGDGWNAPAQRKQKALKTKRAEIEAGLAALLGDPSKAHDEALDQLMDEFYRVAADLLSPITYEGQAAEAMLALQETLSTQLCRTTEERLVAVCRALPTPAVV